MATLDDLFGGNSNGASKVPTATSKLQNAGDTLAGIIVGEPEVVPETDFNTRKPKYMVKLDGLGWKPMPEGEFDTSQDHFALTQIKVHVKDAEGNEYRHFFGGDHKNALKAAMQDSGLPLAEGITLAVKVLEKKGNRRTLAVKLAQ